MVARTYVRPFQVVLDDDFIFGPSYGLSFVRTFCPRWRHENFRVFGPSLSRKMSYFMQLSYKQFNFRGRPSCQFGPGDMILAFQAEVLGSIPRGDKKACNICPGFEPRTEIWDQSWWKIAILVGILSTKNSELFWRPLRDIWSVKFWMGKLRKRAPKGEKRG